MITQKYHTLACAKMAILEENVKLSDMLVICHPVSMAAVLTSQVEHTPVSAILDMKVEFSLCIEEIEDLT